MKSNTLTVAGDWDYYFDSNYVNSAPGFRNRKTFVARDGEAKGDFTRPTGYGFSYRDVKLDHGFTTRQNDGFPLQKWQGFDSSSLPSDRLGWTPYSSSPELLEIALGRLMEDVRGGNQVVVDLAESASTLRMLRSAGSLTGIIKGVIDIVDGEVKRKRRYFERLDKRDRTQKVLDLLSSKWLEARYGWQPAVMSVYDAYDLLHKENLSAVRTIVATAKRPIKQTYTENYPTFIGNIPGSTTVDGTERCRLVIEMFCPGDGIWDWTSLSPSVIAYELIPLSFVLDWVVSIGESLEYLENYLLWKQGFRGGYVTYTGKAQVTTVQSGRLYNGETTLERYFRCEETHVYKNRIVLTELPLPYAPRIRLKMNLSRVLDSVTLTQTLFRKKLRGWGAS